ncbi:MAG: ribosome recycling factor [Chloroflexota bacterium]
MTTEDRDVRSILKDADGRMRGAVASLEDDLAAFRTGRASPHLIDKIKVEMYGAEMNLNELAVISVPEPQQLSIRPYDRSSASAIEKAIMKSDLGIMPNNDGQVIRLNIPPLTEERRRDLSKLVSRRVEEGKVAVRNVRRDLHDEMRKLKDNKDISEDEFYRAEKDLQQVTDKYITEIDEIGKRKEAEVLEV